ncbi:MAG: hypothetical protein EOO61_04760, partial [Hymenobacter sp.]
MRRGNAIHAGARRRGTARIAHELHVDVATPVRRSCVEGCTARRHDSVVAAGRGGAGLEVRGNGLGCTRASCTGATHGRCGGRDGTADARRRRMTEAAGDVA